MQSKKNRRRLVVFVFAACGLLLVGLCGAYWASEWADVALTQEEWDRPFETFDSTLGSLYHGEPRDWVAKRLRRVADAFDAAADAGTRPDLNRQAAENARDIVAALVAAEAHRAPPNGDPVAALVFGLRDVAVMPFTIPGKAQMIGRPGFAALSDHGSDAANRLREMGKKAVPTLIALLDDRRAACRSLGIARARNLTTQSLSSRTAEERIGRKRPGGSP